MCTAVTFGNRFFGRNLDYDRSFGEQVVYTPEAFLFLFPEGKVMRKHHALLGMAHVSQNYPLYYDAMNDKDVLASVQDVEACLNGNGRVLLRPSGTEPVVRVMVEAETEEKCREYTDIIVKAILAGGHGID